MENKQIIGDYLNRQNFIDTIYQYVVNNVKTNSKPICFGIDGEWGQGKTWVIDKLEMKLKGVDLFINEEKEQYNIDKYFVFKYNAWELDYYEDPLIAILVTLVEQLNKIDIAKLDKVLKEVIKTSIKVLVNLCGKISKKILGIDVVETVTEINRKAKDINELSKIKIRTSKNTITEDINSLLVVLNNLSNYKPIVFLVDEIDRCLPEYAIKTLERLHHIFGKVNGSMTIISTDQSQLSKSIEAIYGDNFNTNKYLQKFIAFTFKLSNGDIDKQSLDNRFRKLKQMLGVYNFTTKEAGLIDIFLKDLNAREQNLIIDRTIISLNALLNNKMESNDNTLTIGCILISTINYYEFSNKENFYLKQIGPRSTDIYSNGIRFQKDLKKFFKETLHNPNLNKENILDFILYIALNECIFKERERDHIFNNIAFLTKDIKKEMDDKIDFLINFYHVNVLLH